jgi:hypothetical protein
MRRSVLVALGVAAVVLAYPTATVAKTITDVFITNDAACPVPVVQQGPLAVSGTVDVGKPVVVAGNANDRQPYEKTIFFNQTASTCTQFVCTVSFDPVPAGKRLVITYASAQWALTPGGKAATAVVGVNGNDITDPQILLPAAVLIGFTSYVASGPVTFYAEAGAVPTMSLQGQFVQPVSNTAEAAIVRYYVPA